ncbi:AMP phosphorylase [Candidatus Woesearchaeota archaeon CG10_big_fil_rev_8_21_14_0_10_37_12]|nr:MAG: AMP phosphorylase [Candidatus Woesearchaeota archaeon CG10_big_fil_rev_8_21_14_0_10_37_12]
MKLRVKDMDIATGGIPVVILNKKDARELDLHPMDRVVVKKNSKKIIATLDIAESHKAMPPGRIGLFEETLDAIHAKNNDKIKIDFAEKPESITYIKKKMDGKKLNSKEILCIIQDIVDSKLNDIELTSFIIASYTKGMDMEETAALTQAMVNTGEKLTFNKSPVVDLHSIGGVPGNRTTMLMVPILVAAGCIVPKTSSKAITSPAGTADTMEVLCPVTHSVKHLKKIIDTVGGFIVWGGSINIAPADDIIINVEKPLQIDAQAQMLASIMAKKASVGATHLLLELPIGSGTKITTKKEANKLKQSFEKLSKLLKIKIKIVITNGTEAVGKGIGPILETRDVLWALQNKPEAPKDLVQKSLKLTGILLEFVGKAKKGEGYKKAKQILESGKAYATMEKIVTAQSGKMIQPEQLKVALKTYDVKAKKTGKIYCLLNPTITKLARLAGAPADPEAGVYIHKHCGENIVQGEPILTIYSRSQKKLEYAKKALQKSGGIDII